MTTAKPAAKVDSLGKGKRRVTPPQNAQEMCALLADIMASTLNGEIELADARVALDAAVRIVEVMQADTRQRLAAHMMRGQVSNGKPGGWQMIEPPRNDPKPASVSPISAPTKARPK